MKTIAWLLNFALIGVLMYGFVWMRDQYIIQRNIANEAVWENKKTFWQFTENERWMKEHIERLEEANKYLASKLK